MGKGVSTPNPPPAPIAVPIGYVFNFIYGFERGGILLPQAQTQQAQRIIIGLFFGYGICFGERESVSWGTPRPPAKQILS